MQPCHVYQLIETVFNRSQFYLPHAEIMNSVEYVFNRQVSLVQKAYWTRDVNECKKMRAGKEVKLEMMLFLRDLDLDNECTSVDVSAQVQTAVLNYFDVFGTKVLDFNWDTTPFQTLSTLIPQAKEMLTKIKN